MLTIIFKQALKSGGVKGYDIDKPYLVQLVQPNLKNYTIL